MSQIDLIKCNAYAAVGTPPDTHICLAKTNAYAVGLQSTGHAFLTKLNAYGVCMNVPGIQVLTKLNAYTVVSAEPGVQSTNLTFFDSLSEVFPPELEPSVLPKFVLREMERNPYRPHMAQDNEDVRRDFNEQQRIIRQQHNITQAGDSTFDYGLLLKAYPNQEFTLGSLGRFFHDEFGLIMARFVRFKDFIEHPIQGQPVGRLKFNNSDGVNWTVTNDISKSSPDLAFGFVFLAETPVDDYYGWAVVSGPNPAQVRNFGSDVPDQNAPYVWAESGAVKLGGSGRVIARSWGPAKKAGLPAGSLFIQPEGESILDIIDAVRDALAELTLIEGIIADLEAADERSRRALENSLEVEGELALLSLNFQGQIDRLGELIAGLTSIDWTTMIQQGDANVMAALNVAVTQLNQTIANLALRVTNIETTLGLYSLAEMNDSINAILGLLANAHELYQRIYMPLVDGAIPPTFIQNPDGNLVYVRVE